MISGAWLRLLRSFVSIMSSGPHIVLHIGTHKTGTTSIQDALRVAEERLLQQGILFPQTGRPHGQSGQHMLAWAAIKNKQHKLPEPATPVWDALQEEMLAARPRMTILSSEGFEQASRGEINAIKQQLREHTVTVIVYLRNPRAYLRSAYKQQVKMGKCHISFRQFIEKNIDGCDYRSLVYRWADAFGEESVRVRLFEVASKRGLLRDFARTIGFDEDLLSEEVRTNVSPSDEVIRVVRYLNLFEFKLFSGTHNNTMRRGIIERIRRRLLRGGHAARAVIRGSRLVGAEDLESSEDIVWMQQAMARFDTTYLERYVTRNEKALFL